MNVWVPLFFSSQAMQDQMRNWTQQQVDERDMKKWAEREEERIFAVCGVRIQIFLHILIVGLNFIDVNISNV